MNIFFVDIMVLILGGKSHVGALVGVIFDLFKAYGKIESSHKLDFFLHLI